MLAVRLQKPREIDVIEMPVPVPAAKQALVQVKVAGVCQTDVHIFRGHYVIPCPRVLGHEFAGKIVGLGADVDGFQVGQNVGVYPAEFCGHCEPCRRGRFRACQNFRCLGNTDDGGWAEYVLVDADQLEPLGSLSLDAAVWLEPLSCILRALGDPDAYSDRTVAVVGAGTLGLATVSVLRTLECRKIVAIDPNSEKLDQARSRGVDHVLLVERSVSVVEEQYAEKLRTMVPDGIDFLFDTTGKIVSMVRSTRWIAHGGTIILFGVYPPHKQMSLTPADLFSKEICIRASAGNSRPAYRAAMRMLKSHDLRLDDLVWRRVGLAEIPEALRLLSRHGGKGKIIVEPGKD